MKMNNVELTCNNRTDNRAEVCPEFEEIAQCNTCGLSTTQGSGNASFVVWIRVPASMLSGYVTLRAHVCTRLTEHSSVTARKCRCRQSARPSQ